MRQNQNQNQNKKISFSSVLFQMVDQTMDVVVHVSSSGGNIFRPDNALTPEPRRQTHLSAPAPEKILTLFALRLAVLEKVVYILQYSSVFLFKFMSLFSQVLNVFLMNL